MSKNHDITSGPNARKTFCSFSVSGGAYCYQMGIAAHIQRHFCLKDVLFSGASGGAWPALLLAAGMDIQTAFDAMMNHAVPTYANRSLGAYGCYDLGMKAAFNHLFDGVDLSSKVNGRLALCVTRIELWPFPHLENEMVSHFNSNDDIIDCIIASALIPFALNGRPYVVYRDWICIDGGMTNIAGVRTYILPTQLDFEQDTTKDDNMHIVPRLRAILSIFSRLTSNLRRLGGSSYESMPHFRPFGAYPLQYPMATEPFGVYGHSVSIVNSVVHEVYHSLIERVESFPSSVKENLAAMLLFSQGSSDSSEFGTPTSDGGVLAGSAELGYVVQQQIETSEASAGAAAGQGVIDRLLSHRMLSWMGVLCARTEALALENSYKTAAVGGVEEVSWWVRNEHQIHRHHEKLVAAENGQVYEEDYRITAVVDEDNTVDGENSSGGALVQAKTSDASAQPTESGALNINTDQDNCNGTAVEVAPSSVNSEHREEEACGAMGASVKVGEEEIVNASDFNDVPKNKSLKRRNHKKKSVYWRKKAEAVSVTPCGGMELLITPWMWRKLPVTAYHLTSRGDKAKILLELGFVDAAEHHMELLKFFNTDEYMRRVVHNER
jgi:hypothetical protein